MMIRNFFTPGLAIHSFLVIDESSKKAVVVDPTRQIEPYLAAAAQEGVKITDIVETHVHADFVSGAVDLKAALGGNAAIHCSGLGGKEWTPSYADKIVKDRDSFSLGSVRFEAWHTPGHTPEHIIWVVYDEKRSNDVPQAAFTGDLLFVGSIGRPDLLGAKAEASLAKDLYRSLFKTLEPLPDHLEIFPSHGAGSLCGKNIGAGPSSTLGFERRCNSGMAPRPFEKWLETLYDDMPAAPSYFSRMKKLNLTGPGTAKGLPKVLSPAEVRVLLDKAAVIDARRPDDFSLGSLPGAVNIPAAPMFSFWAAIALPAESNLVLLVENSEDAAPLIHGLKHVGLDRVAGVCVLGQWTFEEKKELLKPVPPIGVDEVFARQSNYYILDVRNGKEWSGGHIKGAHHNELVKVAGAIESVPLDQPVVVVCHSGNRASVISSLLSKRKGAKVYTMRGGMQEWLLAGHPVEKTSSSL